jgi:class 3 adenylate cyclase/tetratricopeptide (TPR) repeat protein
VGFYAIIFTDIVLSTEHRTRYGDVLADAFHAEVDRQTREAVDLHHGRVVKSLGDGLMAIFRGPTEAVLAGVEVQRQLRRRNANAEVALHVRVGVTVGEIEVTIDDVFGYAVNEAARLCSAAEADGVLVSDVAASLARRAEVEFGPVQEVQVTPSAAPSSARPVLISSATESLIPLPAALEFHQHGGRFVGRSHEIQTLLAQWALASAGSVEVAVLTGEPGLGKTTLMGEFARHVEASNGIVLYGQCEERTPAPYQPFVQALGHFVEHCPSRELEQLIRPFSSELASFVPVLGDRLEVAASLRLSNPDSERLRLYDAVGQTLRSLTDFAPVLLIVDDLHWAGTTTIDLLDRVLHDTHQRRIMVLLALRAWDPMTDSYVDHFLADRHRLAHHVQDIALEGLGPQEVSELASEWKHRSDIDASETNELWQITAGNPLFVSQVLRTTGANEVVPAQIPRGVAEVITRQLERLNTETRNLLAYGALVGPRFELSVVTEAARITREEALGCLEDAVHAGVVRSLEGSPLRYEFAHALVQRTIEGQSSAARRSEIHAKIAEVLEGTLALTPEDRLRRLAMHLYEAGEFGDPVKGVLLGCEAAELSIRQLAIADAFEQLRRVEVLRVLAPDQRRDTQVAVLWAEAKCLSSEPDARDTQLKAVALAERCGDSVLLARAALANSRGYFSIFGSTDEERIHALESAIAKCESENLATRAMLLSRLQIELTFDVSGRRNVAMVDEALSLARSLDEPSILANVLRDRQYVLGAPQYCEIRVTEVREMIDIARAMGDRALEIHSCRLMCAAATEIADVEQVDVSLARLSELTGEVDLVVSRWELASVRTSRALLGGQLKEAARLVKEAFALGGEAGQPDAYVFTGAQLMQLNYLRGRLPLVMDTFLEMTPSEVTGPLSAWVARMLYEAGRHNEAAQWWERSLTTGLSTQFEIGIQAGLLLNSWAFMASVIDPGPETRGDIHDRLSPFADRLFNQLAPDQPGHHFLALMADASGNHREADEHFKSSITLLDRIGAPLMTAISQVAWARSLARRDDIRRARELANVALDVARETGATKIHDDAEELVGTLS